MIAPQAFPGTPQFRPFGTIQYPVVKEKVFEYGLDKRLSWGEIRAWPSFGAESGATGVRIFFQRPRVTRL
jgi:hypothetical protein